jgi:hypothetical protein
MSQGNKDDQLSLDLRLDIAAVKEIDGVQAGVFEDGTPFMTERGLARIAGISQGTLNALGRNYGTSGGGERLREVKIAKTLENKGFKGERLYQKILVDGTETNAYYGVVCMSVIKYYAFQAGRFCNETAERNYDILADTSFKDFVYQMVGYKPINADEVAALSWQNLQARLLLNPIPSTHFSVLEESYNLELKIIRGGLRLDQHTIPDISIGATWANYWKANGLEQEHGQRIKHPHIYPQSYSQSKANGSIDYWIYPIDAVAVFKKWLQTEYVKVKLPKYLKDRVRDKTLPASKAQALIEALVPKELPHAS